MARNPFFRGFVPVTDNYCGTPWQRQIGASGDEGEASVPSKPPGPCDPGVLASLLAKANGRCDDPAYVAHTSAYGCQRCPPFYTCHKGHCVPWEMALKSATGGEFALDRSPPAQGGLPWPRKG